MRTILTCRRPGQADDGELARVVTRCLGDTDETGDAGNIDLDGNVGLVYHISPIREGCHGRELTIEPPFSIILRIWARIE